ncbi:hypothetical protein CAPTEDRAFT_188231 [Capitella teleta]|uniref:G-protein coupled receptors family 1 profile domain-containing protein n=1 Tax=Capitella teleta TaxID=283909 RepID=R7TFE5_CAPTE|nr:hypothetical protein CAPTEDRAFT_188231 [Capitella teleta]|eukprot:ELT92222.1 hypothetical protein CAPTEDRAFT_188231 [Capitella teleta]
MSKAYRCEIPITLAQMNTIFMGFNAVVIFSIPAISLLLLYAKIIYTLHRSISTALQMRTVRSTENGKKSSEVDDIRGRKQVMLMLISMLALFIVSWGPYLISRFELSIRPHAHEFFEMDYLDHLLFVIFGAFSFGSAALNPIMIPINSTKFRRAILRAFGIRKSKKTASSRTSSETVL